MLLEFEKPIALLEEKLAAMKVRAEAGDTRCAQSVARLEREIRSLQEEIFQKLTRWQRVQLSRHADRPYTLDYIEHMAETFVELHGDRKAGDDKAMVGGFAQLDDTVIMLIGHQKGRTTKERQVRNFGMANPEGYRKALRLMRLAEKFNKPIVTLIDTPGAYPGMEAEAKGQAEAIAQNIQSMFTLRVPVLCVVIGEGASGGALGIGVGDKTLMLENTWYSVISPESCASILWKSWDYKEQAAEQLQLTAADMLRLKLIDGIIKEPIGGAHRDVSAMADALKKEILAHLDVLNTINPDKRCENRIEKFCKIGAVTQAA